MIDPIHWTCESCGKRDWITLPEPKEEREEHAGVCRHCQHVAIIVTGAKWRGGQRDISWSMIRKAAKGLFG